MRQENGRAGFNLGPQVRMTLSGTKVGEVLQRVELPPPEYSRREGAAILLQRSTPVHNMPKNIIDINYLCDVL